MKRVLHGLVCVIAMAAGPASAAYQSFFGEDRNSSATAPLASVPNSASAEALFLANLAAGVGTEDFEAQALGSADGRTLAFPGFSGSIGATLSGTGITVDAVVPGSTDGAGRYSVPSGSSARYVRANAGADFAVVFDQAISAFGFYGVDIGDFSGQLSLQLLAQDFSVLDTVAVPHTVGAGGSTDGSVLFMGLISNAVATDFWAVAFVSTDSGDIFAFDRFSIAEREQIGPPPNPTPLPGSLALLGAGLLGLGAVTRRRRV